MGYMTRLGLWGPGTPFPAGFSSNKRQGNVDRTPFLESVNKGGVGMMELVAMHLRKQGRYISRTLSYEGCSFVIDDNAVPFSAVQLYDECASLFQRIYSELTDSLAGNPEDVAEFSARFPEKAKPKKRGRAAAESESRPCLKCRIDGYCQWINYTRCHTFQYNSLLFLSVFPVFFVFFS